MKKRSPIPRATYRLQLNRDFTFTQATAIVPYLTELGISHCYISPCLKARPGSMHGYDIVDHNSLNPEIGSAEEFDRFVEVLHDHGMGLIMDIVPNHMGVGSDNAWWMDVLENGKSSTYASFFDIDWHPLKHELEGKVLVPVLHDHYGAVLESGELKLVFQCPRGEFRIDYRNHCFPIGPQEYPWILRSCESRLIDELGAQNPELLEFQSLIAAFGHLPRRTEIDTERIAERNRDKEIHKRRLSELCSRSPAIGAAILSAVDSFNGQPGNPASFDTLHELIKRQAYRLANWRVASDDINYRRFFDTDDLAAIRMENENVFQETHRLILSLIAQGKVDGLRLDHPDGLNNPAQYFERLQRSIAAGAGSARAHAMNETSKDASNPAQTPADASAYVVVEKILTGDEPLPAAWAVAGTTGYDFANLVNGLFVDPAAEARLQRIYRNFTGEEIDFDDLAYRCRKLIMRVTLASELNVLASQLSRIALSKRRTCDFTLNSLRAALTEVVASFPVYRTYIGAPGASSCVTENDERHIRIAVDTAKRRSPAADTSIFDFVADVLLNRIAEGQDPAYQNAVTTFALKFQQFTSPVMAKGLEDTAFYRANRLVSLNDVGGDLHTFGTATAQFHAANQQRLRAWPHTMLATSTHDSKRSEDVRARINVLSEIAGPWRLRVLSWRQLNGAHKQLVNGQPAPSPNDEYLLYQTLLGAWPSHSPDSGCAADKPAADKPEDKNGESFCRRIEDYMLKAVREAKENTSWINRNQEYEGAISSFIRKMLTPGPGDSFLEDFLPFQRQVARIGIWNSLSQTILKLTCPGVPDTYQGTELWDFSLVDPDNRRPVDYERRRIVLASLGELNEAGDAATISRLMQSPEAGPLKCYSIWKTLNLRRQQPELFDRGEYVPLTATGEKAGHIVAFARRYGRSVALVIVPRLVGTLLKNCATGAPPIGSEVSEEVLGGVWGDTRVRLEFCNCFSKARNIFTGEVLELQTGENSPESKAGEPRRKGAHNQCHNPESYLDASRVLGKFPVAVCVLE